MIDSHWGTARRDVALLSAETLGVQEFLGQFGSGRGLRRHERRQLRDLVERSDELCMVIDPRPGLHVLDMNDAYARATLTVRDRAAGERLFRLFPDNPDVPEAQGVSNLFDSLHVAAHSGARHAMGVQRYDVRDADGRFVERSWLPVNIPIIDDGGRLLYILHHVVQLPGENG